MALFLSTFINKVDRKGRVSVPAPFRAAVADQSFKGIVAFRSYREAAIEACAIDRMERLSESVDALDQFSEEQDDFASTIFADAHQLPIDGDGRIILPSALVEHAGITDAAAFVGRGGTFQVFGGVISAREIDVKTRRARAQSDGFLDELNGARVVALLRGKHAQQMQGIRILRFTIQHLAVKPGGFREVSDTVKRDGILQY